ncbi:hypothetical protein CASFOL_020604 [Castilleja foliolosa]|uniref:Bifunctional inhibitor/plant lipid transfer protein/seed storage helical domain-containing protein n=1 Tax=Castilleja foliolosa TaxID=1961234 RepID=A0ABD3D245_9LAMI
MNTKLAIIICVMLVVFFGEVESASSACNKPMVGYMCMQRRSKDIPAPTQACCNAIAKNTCNVNLGIANDIQRKKLKDTCCEKKMITCT